MPAVNFTLKELQILKTIVRNNRYGNVKGTDRDKPQLHPIPIRIGKVDSSLGAISVSSSGLISVNPGDVTLAFINHSDEIELTQKKVTAYNLSTVTVGSEVVILEREPISGKWIVGGISEEPTERAIKEGKLTSTLTSATGASMAVYSTTASTDGSWVSAGETIQIIDRAGWSGVTDQYCMAIFMGTTASGVGEYRPVVIGCTVSVSTTGASS